MQVSRGMLLPGGSESEYLLAFRTKHAVTNLGFQILIHRENRRSEEDALKPSTQTL